MHVISSFLPGLLLVEMQWVAGQRTRRTLTDPTVTGCKLYYKPARGNGLDPACRISPASLTGASCVCAKSIT